MPVSCFGNNGQVENDRAEKNGKVTFSFNYGNLTLVSQYQHYANPTFCVGFYRDDLRVDCQAYYDNKFTKYSLCVVDESNNLTHTLQDRREVVRAYFSVDRAALFITVIHNLLQFDGTTNVC
jgi:hypothetical protein